jgi:hypothetical protein
MNYLLLSLLLILQPPTPSPEGPKAVIEGPTTGLTGDLVVLKGTGSVGKGAKWITPEVNTLQCTNCDFVPDVAFATGKPGKYKFILIVTMNDEITYAEHEVTIVNLVAPDPPPVVNPPPVGPSPEKGLAELSKQLSISRNDSVTRQALAAALDSQIATIKQMCRESRCPTTDSAKLMVTASLNNALLSRKGESKKVDWEVWRKPLYDKINAFKYLTLNDYLADIEQISKGLKQ